MAQYEHTLTWTCLRCWQSRDKKYITTSRELDVATAELCGGTRDALHPPVEMAWSNHRSHAILYAQGGYVATSSHIPPGKAVDFNMTTPRNSFGALGAYVEESFLRDIARLHTPKPGPAVLAPLKAKEQAEIAQKIVEGDLVQLVAKAGAVMQGEVLAVRRHGASVKVRLKGFDHVGGNSGGHHVYWPLSEYDVEILVETYRLTDEDRAVAVLAGYGEDAFKIMSESRRQTLRRSYGAKARRVAEILKGDGG